MKIRLRGLGAAWLALPAVALAAPITTTVRIESPAATVLPPTSVVVDPAGADVTVNDTTDADTFTTTAGSAFAQLGSATATAGMVLGFQSFAFGPMVERIGSASSTASAFWRFKVNGVAAAVGAADYTLQAGDSVSWSLVTDWEAPELAVAVSSDAVRVGSPFTVTVVRVDNAGATTPAAGATVHYGSATATADVGGTAVFAPSASGVRAVRATESPASGTVRSESLDVCAYAADPTVCGLPASGGDDLVAPGTEILTPAAGARTAALRLVRGRVSPDRSDVAAVHVAIARRSGRLCRFMGPLGRFGARRSCANRRWLPARVSGTNWRYALPGPVPATRYRIWSRATDGAGNREHVTLAGINVIGLAVIRSERSS